MNQFWHRVIFSIMGYEIRGEHLIELASLLALLLSLDWLLSYWGLPAILRKFPTEAERQKQVIRRLQPLILVFTLLLWVWFTGLDPKFYERQGKWVGLSTVLQGLVYWLVARLGDLILGRVIVRGFFKKQERQKRPFLLGGQAGIERDWQVSNRYIKYVTYTLVALIMIRLFGADLLLHEGKLGKLEYHLYLSNLLIAALVILVAQLLTWPPPPHQHRCPICHQPPDQLFHLFHCSFASPAFVGGQYHGHCWRRGGLAGGCRDWSATNLQ
jgi:hypothetical protein